MNEDAYLGPYIARRKLLIPNGPGQVPSSLRVAKYGVFFFDGDEPVDIRHLLQTQAIQPYTGDMEALEAKNG